MSYHRTGIVIVVALAIGLSVGCGRPTVPGQQFQAERFDPQGGERESGALPENPIRQWGEEGAKVQIEAYYPIDESHEVVMALLEELAEGHPGKVHAKYVDYRTREGAQLLAQRQMGGTGLLINGNVRVKIQAEPNPYEVEFVGDMGRFWTADDLRAAVAQEVKAAYGEAGSAG